MFKVPAGDLAVRPYLTPGQAARVLGRGASFWRRKFDAGTVQGYTTNGKPGRVNRYIEAALRLKDYLGMQSRGDGRASSLTDAERRHA